MTVTPPWTEDELAHLRSAYAKGDHCRDIAEHLGRTYAAVHQRAHLLGLKGRQRRASEAVRHDYFRAIDRPEKAYLLGLMAADGWVSRSGIRLGISLMDGDRPLVEFARDEIAPGTRLSSFTTRSGGLMARLELTSPGLRDDLARYGVCAGKHLSMTWASGVPSKWHRAFLHGYFDGEGTARIKPDRRRGTESPVWLLPGNRAFLAGASEFVLSQTGVQFAGPYEVRSKSGHLMRMETSGRRALAVDRWLHDAHSFGLARKRFPEEIAS